MDKKGVIWDTFADWFLGGIILLTGMLFYFYISGMQTDRLEVTILQKSAMLNQETIIPYLKTEVVPGKTLADIIMLSYLNNEKEKTSDYIDEFLEKIYSSKVCWKLILNEKDWIEKNKCTTNKVLLDSSIDMPLLTNEILKVKLEILGYSR
jgi:hypothetical protein